MVIKFKGVFFRVNAIRKTLTYVRILLNRTFKVVRSVLKVENDETYFIEI